MQHGGRYSKYSSECSSSGSSRVVVLFAMSDAAPDALQSLGEHFVASRLQAFRGSRLRKAAANQMPLSTVKSCTTETVYFGVCGDGDVIEEDKRVNHLQFIEKSTFDPLSVEKESATDN